MRRSAVVAASSTTSISAPRGDQPVDLSPAAGLLATTGSAAAKSAGAGSCGAQAPSNGEGRFGGVLSAQAIAASGSCAVHNTSDPANGGPPLIWWGGPVMASSTSSPIVVTPIFWNPSGGGHPTSGCTVASDDTTNIYADGTGYNACLDDEQLTNEIQRVIDAGGLPQNDYSHIYVMFTPKHVESCYYAGSTLTSSNGCTINHHPSARYCAYHSMMGTNWPAYGTIYANMPYPVYHSPVGFTCGTDAGGHGTIESPNFNGSATSMDADVEVSPLSHEVMESITDPNVFNGWFDAIGNENGDDCAYVYGNGTWTDMGGTPGRFYNQTINTHHYITQEEFSNADWFHTNGTGGCVRSESAVSH